MQFSRIITPLPLLLLAACTADDAVSDTAADHTLTLTSAIDPYVGVDDAGTRGTLAGDAHAVGDLIRLKIICPYVTDTQNGESTWGNTADSFWLLRWNGSGWKRLEANEYFDITSSYSYSTTVDLFSYYDAQATPYVYTASTWTEERLFRDKASSLIDQYCNVFHHDQSREKNYLASDILWAQQFAQTGAWNIHLSFHHVMACLLITLDDEGLTDKISDNAVLTLEGMPDIDQQEIAVGDYYAHRSKSNSAYGYRQKCACAYELNGIVLGITTIDETKKRALVNPLSGFYQTIQEKYGLTAIGGYGNGYAGDVVPNTGTYTCLPIGNKQYRLIVPPCLLDEPATFWLRDDTRRFRLSLEQLRFEQEHLYHVTIKLREILE